MQVLTTAPPPPCMQGLGSNRGFHSALDAVWCVHLLHNEGLEASLLERNFWYDLMLLGPWQAGAGLLKPAEGWCADPASRYADGAIVRTKQNYTNPQSKRLFRGEGAPVLISFWVMYLTSLTHPRQSTLSLS